MEMLQESIHKINLIHDIVELNDLMRRCVELYEMTAVIFIYDYMKRNKHDPNEITYRLINKLHSKTVLENSNLIIPDNAKKKLQSRRRIHKIMKGYDYSKALKNKEIIIDYLHKNPYEYDGKNKNHEKRLCNELKSNCKLSIDEIRHILTYLKRCKFFI